MLNGQGKAEESPGVIVLGMHRSGTSLLSGLLNISRFTVGSPLIGTKAENSKGFFERHDVVYTNICLMQTQGVDYSYNTYRYNHSLALSLLKREYDTRKFTTFYKFPRAAAFLNDQKNVPWMLKDPRLCITLPAWLPFIDRKPAVLFTYRHPLDVAKSMNKREFERLPLMRGLTLWYLYNKLAIQHSKELCRVITVERLVLLHPKQELDRILDDLQGCGLSVPHRPTKEELEKFVDVSLQHSFDSLNDKICADNTFPLSQNISLSLLAHNVDLSFYQETLRLYCALEDRSAFSDSFQWNETIRDNWKPSSVPYKCHSPKAGSHLKNSVVAR
jgi:hypothetical protein